MSSQTLTSAGSRISGKAIFFGIIIAGMAMAGLALIAEVMSNDGNPVYLAKFSPSEGNQIAGPALEVIGNGRASAPAESATLQLLVVHDARPDSFDAASAAGGTGLASSLVNPMMNALTTAGADREGINVVSSPALISVCDDFSRCMSSRFDIVLEQPTMATINSIVSAAGAEAASLDITVQDVGVAFSVADCRPLIARARELATIDAQQRAMDQASVLGVELGQLLLSSEAPSTTPVDTNGCPVQAGGSADSWWTAGSTGLTVPPFDPSAPAEAWVAVQIGLTYAMDGEVEQPQPAEESA